MTSPQSAPSSAHLIELVLELRGPVHAVEPLMRALRTRLEAAEGRFARQIGTHVSQEFGALTCSVRAAVDGTDLLATVELAVRGMRPLIASVLADQSEVTAHETAVHARLL